MFSAQKAKILFHEGASPIEALQPSKRRGTRAPTSERLPHCLALLLGNLHFWPSGQLLGRNDETAYDSFVRDAAQATLLTSLAAGRGREDGAEEACA